MASLTFDHGWLHIHNYNFLHNQGDDLPYERAAHNVLVLARP